MRLERCWRAMGGCLLLALAGCGPSGGPSEVADSDPGRTINVACTTTMVSDLAREVGGDKVVVKGLMGPGVDPHLYKASALDVSTLQQADVIFFNGLLLEGKLQEVFTKMSRSKKFIYALAEGVDSSRLLEPPEFAGHYDPHIWFDVSLWEECVAVVVQGLSEFDPSQADSFRERGDQARARMQALHRWALEKAAEVPEERRILVTSHDAYNYFGRAYGFQVVGLQGISTVDDPSLAAMAKLVDFIKDKQVKAIFVESSVSPAAIRRISEDAGVVVGGELFSDAMGTPGQIENGYDLGTYEGMVKHNLNTIVGALR